MMAPVLGSGCWPAWMARVPMPRLATLLDFFMAIRDSAGERVLAKRLSYSPSHAKLNHRVPAVQSHVGTAAGDDMRRRIAHCGRTRDLCGCPPCAGCARMRPAGCRSQRDPLMTNSPAGPSASPLLEGVVDGVSNHTVYGWAWLDDGGSSPVRVDVHADGSLLGSGEANRFRPDLAAAGKREGHCAFAITLEPPPTPGTAAADILPLPIGTAQLEGSLDQCGPRLVRGWVRWLDGSSHPVMMSLREGERELLCFAANQWRADIAELRQNDGYCGFELAVPESLCDGRLHRLELRLADSDTRLLGAPFNVRITPTGKASRAAARAPAPLGRGPVTAPMTLSVIVNFYNMRREAERTLTSLRSDYQRGADDLDYEVLCIDNGSQPPLEADWIASFGPQFRLVRPSRHLASLCAALNEAARQARGKYLAVMIDGAHLLTPGVFEEARQAWRQDPAAVVALRHWFVGGDQRWLARVGYTREQEDRLFERIRWPANGYELFRIGAPIGEHPEPWFDGLGESNCLMLPTALFDRIGGYDEAFDQAGGGFANLDLWRRASEAAEGALICLVGEATFHQFHGGTTTNVDDIEKDVRVRAYAHAYRALRGQEFDPVHRSALQFRGRVSSEFATGVRQRSLLPLRMDITDQIRPGRLALHFDDGAQTHLQSVYAECGLQNEVRWLGQPVGVAPADLISLQEILRQLCPEAIVAVGVEPGLVGFIDSILSMLDATDSRVLHVQPSAAAATPPARVTWLPGPPCTPEVLSAARRWVGAAETVLVLLVAGPATEFSLRSLRGYGALVSYRSWLVCVGTLFGQPWLGYSRHHHAQVIRDFTRADSSFVIDRQWNRQLISTCPGGYLRKVGGVMTAASYDASLDQPIAGPRPPTGPLR